MRLIESGRTFSYEKKKKKKKNPTKKPKKKKKTQQKNKQQNKNKRGAQGLAKCGSHYVVYTICINTLK